MNKFFHIGRSGARVLVYFLWWYINTSKVVMSFGHVKYCEKLRIKILTAY